MAVRLGAADIVVFISTFMKENVPPPLQFSGISRLREIPSYGLQLFVSFSGPSMTFHLGFYRINCNFPLWSWFSSIRVLWCGPIKLTIRAFFSIISSAERIQKSNASCILSPRLTVTPTPGPVQLCSEHFQLVRTYHEWLGS